MATLMRSSTGNPSVLLKHVAIGTGVVALAYLSYRYMKWTKSERTLLQQLQWINKQLKAKEIIVLDCDADWPEVVSRLQSELSVFKVLGLDAEWVPGENPVALLQLATHSGLVILIRLCQLQTIPQEFRAIMSDKGILKLGVGIINDALKLGLDHDICVRGCVDLRHLARRQRKTPIGKSGLSGLSLAFLGYHLVKVRSITCSNWEVDSLHEKQIQYAVADALVAVRIFTKILENKNNFPSVDDHPEKIIWQKALSLCQGIVDVKYSNNLYVDAQEIDYRALFQKLNTNTKTPEIKPRKDVVRAYSASKKPIYDNWYLWAPDGQLLCTCDSKKAKWYVEKGLGKQVSEDTVQLLFEPSGRPQSEKNYYLQDKENVCVVCGSKKWHNRKNIVPHEYRKYFPPVMKEHRSHDVLPLCTSCHQRSNLYDNSLKQYYANLCDAPMATDKGVKYHIDQELKNVNSAARALLKSGHKLPASRQHELEQVLCAYFSVTEVNKKLLEDAAEIDPKLPNGQFAPHGQKVVEHVIANEGLLEFERKWRQHFLDTMKPKYLFDLWSVDHGHDKLQDLNKGMNSALSSNVNTKK